MGPMGFGGPPPSEMNEKLKEQKPHGLREVPSYLKRVISGFLKRLVYIVGLVWEARKSLLFMMIFMALFNGFSPVLSAYISANLLNRVAEAISMDSIAFSEVCSMILPPMLLQFGYMFFVSMINSISNMVTRISSELVTNHVKCKIMNKAKEIDLASFDMPEFYEKFENASREAGMRPIQVINATFSIVSTIISAVSFVVILVAVSPFAPLAVIVLSLPSAIITFSYRKKNFRYMRHHSKERRQMSYYSDMLVNKDTVKELRLFDLSETFIFNYNAVFKKYFKGIKGLIVGEGIWSIGITLVTTAVNCALFFLIAYTVTENNGMIGDYSLYTGALTSIASCVAALVTTTSGIYEGTLFIENMIVFMNEKRSIKPIVDNALDIQRHVAHTIEFKNVSFRYPGTSRDVLKNVSFKVNAGDTVVLVGLNGAGKTTLLKLLTRLYDPTDGEILLDGHDIREYDTKQLYSMFGAIFQDFGKYAFTVRENIAFGDIRREIEEERIEESARAASANEFVEMLPRGYSTPLMRVFEKDGIEPSIGQWQKLAIARAFYSDSDVLILDEPTASLDAIAEQEIFNQFDELRKNKITFFVSHRLSSATVATKILVLENGALVEEGDHRTLMDKGGIYAKLFSTQANRYISDAKDREELELPAAEHLEMGHAPMPPRGMGRAPMPPRTKWNDRR